MQLGQRPALGEWDEQLDVAQRALELVGDPVALVAKRVSGLRPIPPLLTDIAGRLATLSRPRRYSRRIPPVS